MKTLRLMLVAILLTTVVTTMTNAQSKKEGEQNKSDKVDQTNREKIKKEELPAAAIKLLEGDAFKGWSIAQAYRLKVKDAQGKDTSEFEYEVEVKKDKLFQVLKFDKDGNSK